MKNNTEGFGKRIAEKREEMGLSLRQAGARIGISHTYLSAIEKDEDPRTKKSITPSSGVIFRICKEYGLDFVREMQYFDFPDEPVFYRYIAEKIGEMKKTNPRRYKQLLCIIEGEKEL